MLCSVFRYFLFRGFISWFVTRVTRWVQLVDQKLVTLPEHLSSSQDILDRSYKALKYKVKHLSSNIESPKTRICNQNILT
jgi:hypothetical protein